MIIFNFETDFNLENTDKITNWISTTIKKENYQLGDISYVFCDDKYLLDLNNKYLNHDTLTDIISFDYSEEDIISGDIFISIERVKDNAKKFKISFIEELYRVIIHGVLHYCGYKDKTEIEKIEMRNKENKYLSLIERNQ